MKKISTAILTLSLILCAVVSASATSININGTDVNVSSYNIDDNNYFRLRDIAIVLSGTKAQFDVAWNNNSVEITTNTAYTGKNTLTEKSDKNPEILHSYTPVYLNGKRVSAKAYNIDGYNYFKLRDIARLVDFGVFWWQDSGVSIDTSRGYALTIDEEKRVLIEYAHRRHPEFVEQNKGWHEDKKYYNFADVDRDGHYELAVKKSAGITIYKVIDGEAKRMYCDPLPESTGETQYHYVTYKGDDCIAYITKEKIVLYILSCDSLSPVKELSLDEIDEIVFPKRYTLEELG